MVTPVFGVDLRSHAREAGLAVPGCCTPPNGRLFEGLTAVPPPAWKDAKQLSGSSQERGATKSRESPGDKGRIGELCRSKEGAFNMLLFGSGT